MLFEASFPEHPRIPNVPSLAYIFVGDSKGLSSLRFLYFFVFLDPKDARFSATKCLMPHLRLSKFVYFGTNRKRVWGFLLVLNSNLGPIFPILEILELLYADSHFFPYPPLFRPKLNVFPLEKKGVCRERTDRAN